MATFGEIESGRALRAYTHIASGKWVFRSIPAETQTDRARSIRRPDKTKEVMALLDSLEATILIVDEKSVCNLLTQVLSADYTCITASTVEEAMMFLSNGFFDVVIADIGMPDDTGFTLCDFIQKTHPETVILIISGAAGKDKIALHGAFDCIEEPFEPAHVQMAVGRAISYSRLRRNLTCASRPG